MRTCRSPSHIPLHELQQGRDCSWPTVDQEGRQEVGAPRKGPLGAEHSHSDTRALTLLCEQGPPHTK